MTVLYSILHLLVDGLCAMAMFGRYIPLQDGYFYILLYNFCAFALQMPFGVLLDALNVKKGNGKRKPDYAYITAALGVLCTIAGAVTHPVVLGIGNALFHVGGGVGTIYEDREINGRGTRLGIFVAPGALGLYLGTMIIVGNEAGGSGWRLWIVGAGILMSVLLLVGKLYLQGHLPESKTDGHLRRGSACRESVQPYSQWESACRESDQLHSQRGSICGGNSLLQGQSVKGAVILSVCCLLVVILRSYIGMVVTFPWKTGALAGMLSVLALVGGKMAGGGPGGMERNFSDGCGFADGSGVLLSFFIPDAHGTGGIVFVQHDDAGHFILDDMCFPSNAGICFWVSDLCAVSGIPSRLLSV